MLASCSNSERWRGEVHDSVPWVKYDGCPKLAGAMALASSGRQFKEFCNNLVFCIFKLKRDESDRAYSCQKTKPKHTAAFVSRITPQTERAQTLQCRKESWTFSTFTLELSTEQTPNYLAWLITGRSIRLMQCKRLRSAFKIIKYKIESHYVFFHLINLTKKNL